MQTIVDSRKQRRTFWQTLGPDRPRFVAGAWQFGPGNLTTAVQAGSALQYALIWVIVVSTILMIFLTDMSVRLGIKTPDLADLVDQGSPGQACRRHRRHRGLPDHPLLLGRQRRRIRARTVDADSGQPPVMWTIICTIAVAAVLFIRSVYRVIEKVLIGIVALMAICFIAQAFIANADWAQAASGLIPSCPGRLLAAHRRARRHELLASTPPSTPPTARRSVGAREDDYRDVTIVDTIPGIIAPGIMTALVIVVAAAVLGTDRRGRDIDRRPRRHLRAARRTRRRLHLRARLLRRRLLLHDPERDRRRHDALRRRRTRRLRRAPARRRVTTDSSSPSA